ncbi:MAG: hypothetical protein P4L03_03005 [Terracidiphilus sp.]|nr:hypothetical protein [Terracidiphilus sp.]
MIPALSAAGLARLTEELSIATPSPIAPEWRIFHNPAAVPEGAIDDAEYCGAAAIPAASETGGLINQITKSGTNKFHGTVYEYNQVSALRGNMYFNNRNKVARPHSIYNQYGINASGPVWIPRLYDGHNKLYWLFPYEGIRDSAPFSGLTTVPTDAEKNGDFSALLGAGSSYQIYDPATGKLSGGVVTRTPFTGNIIPTARLNPVALALLKYYPEPNVSASRIDGYDNYFSSSSNPDVFSTQFGCIDFSTANNKVFADIRHNERTQFASNYLGNISTGSNLFRQNWGGTIGDVAIVNPKTVANLRLNWTRFVEQYSVPSDGFDASTLGFPASMTS